MRILKFIQFLPDISLYSQTDGAANNKMPTPLTIDPTRAKKMTESEWTSSKCIFYCRIYS